MLFVAPPLLSHPYPVNFHPIMLALCLMLLYYF